MFIKDLYINPDNVCTIALFSENGYYGLQINGTRINFGEYDEYDYNTDWKSITKELKDYQKQIANEIEKGHKEIVIKQQEDFENAMSIYIGGDNE